MSLRLNCSGCGKVILAPEGSEGKPFRCPGCRAVNVVSGRSTAVPVAPVPDPDLPPSWLPGPREDPRVDLALTQDSPPPAVQEPPPPFLAALAQASGAPPPAPAAPERPEWFQATPSHVVSGEALVGLLGILCGLTITLGVGAAFFGLILSLYSAGTAPGTTAEAAAAQRFIGFNLLGLAASSIPTAIGLHLGKRAAELALGIAHDLRGQLRFLSDIREDRRRDASST